MTKPKITKPKKTGKVKGKQSAKTAKAENVATYFADAPTLKVKPKADKPLTPKQEAFAQAYVETSNAAEAYRRAYPASRNWKPEGLYPQASRALADSKIAARVAQIQAAVAKRTEVTVESLVEELEQARKLADKIEQPSAAVQAVMGKAKLLGLVIDKGELTGKNGGSIKVEDTSEPESDLEIARRMVFYMANVANEETSNVQH